MSFNKIAKGDTFLDRNVNFEYMSSSYGGKRMFSKHHGFQATCDKELRVLDWQKNTYISAIKRQQEQFRIKSSKLLRRRDELKKEDGTTQTLALRCYSAPVSITRGGEIRGTATGKTSGEIHILEVGGNSKQSNMRSFYLCTDSTNPYSVLGDFTDSFGSDNSSSKIPRLSEPFYAIVHRRRGSHNRFVDRNMLRFRSQFMNEIITPSPDLVRQADEYLSNIFPRENIARVQESLEMIEIVRDSSLHNMVSLYIKMRDINKGHMIEDKNVMAISSGDANVKTAPLALPKKSMALVVSKRPFTASPGHATREMYPSIQERISNHNINDRDFTICNKVENSNTDIYLHRTSNGYKSRRQCALSAGAPRRKRRRVRFAEPTSETFDEQNVITSNNQTSLTSKTLPAFPSDTSHTSSTQQPHTSSAPVMPPSALKKRHSPSGSSYSRVAKDNLIVAFDKFTEDVNLSNMRKLVAMASNMRLNTTPETGLTRRLSAR